MDLYETLLYYTLVTIVLFAFYKMIISVENENKQLKERNFQLAHWLQLAELQTGITYYSSIAVDAVPGEMNKHFSSFLQDRIQNMGVAPRGAQDCTPPETSLRNQ